MRFDQPAEPRPLFGMYIVLMLQVRALPNQLVGAIVPEHVRQREIGHDKTAVRRGPEHALDGIFHERAIVPLCSLEGRGELLPRTLDLRESGSRGGDGNGGALLGFHDLPPVGFHILRSCLRRR